MSSAPSKKKAKKKKPLSLKHEVTSATAFQLAGGAEHLTKSWSEQPDSLRMLVDCAALLGIADKLDSECPPFSPDALAKRAIGLINACELSLKQETQQASSRVKDQLVKLMEMKSPVPHQSFEAGAKALLKISDPRAGRLEAGIKRLLKLDFENDPRPPRRPEEYRRLNVLEEGETYPSTSLKSFITGEMAWYHAKGFAPKDFRRLKAFKIKNPSSSQ